MANENHDPENGQFTTADKAGHSENSTKQKVLKQLGLNQSDIGNVIERPKIDTPNYHQERDYIVIDDGEHKGETYQSIQDYIDSVGKEEADLKNRLANFLKNNNFNVSEEEINQILSKDKEMWKNFFDSNDENASLREMLQNPEIKNQLLDYYIQKFPFVLGMFKNDRDVIWNGLSEEQKIEFLKDMLNEKKEK